MINLWVLKLEILLYAVTHDPCPEPEMRDYLMNKGLFAALRTFKDYLKTLEYEGLLEKDQNYGKANIWHPSKKGIKVLHDRVAALESELAATQRVVELYNGLSGE